MPKFEPPVPVWSESLHPSVGPSAVSSLRFVAFAPNLEHGHAARFQWPLGRKTRILYSAHSQRVTTTIQNSINQLMTKCRLRGKDRYKFSESVALSFNHLGCRRFGRGVDAHVIFSDQFRILETALDRIDTFEFDKLSLDSGLLCLNARDVGRGGWGPV